MKKLTVLCILLCMAGCKNNPAPTVIEVNNCLHVDASLIKPIEWPNRQQPITGKQFTQDLAKIRADIRRDNGNKLILKKQIEECHAGS